MALEKALPLIDDRNYDSLLAEVRTRIARYTPEWTPVWTDVNDNDPGMTMVQVFAWLADMLMYRMNKVPELNYIKFLQLLGIEVNPAEAAQTEVSFPMSDRAVASSVIVPPRTQIAAEDAESGSQIVFETERSLIAIKARLAALLGFDGYTCLDVTHDNEEAKQGFYPFGPEARAGSALLLGFASPDPFPPVELNLALWTLPDAQKSASLTCGLPETPSFGPATIRWEFSNGSAWRKLSVLKDETRALTRSGHVYLQMPDKGLQPTNTPPETAIPSMKQSLYWLRARVEQSQYERPPQLLALRTNTVSVRQAETIRDEVLGGSTGRRDQVFRLANSQVLHDSLRLEVDEGNRPEIWTRVDDFFASKPTDHHYVLNRTTGEIRFGDGRNGSIPVANAANPDGNIIAREYRFGGGKRGNVQAGKINKLLTAIAGIDDNKVANLLPAHSGREEETLEEAKKRAPQSIKSRCRAVTADDFEVLAMQAATIQRAKALPLFHPGFPGVKVPGVVTVIVVPDGDGPSPVPSEGTLRTVCAYLEQRRLLTTELYVISPQYQCVEIHAEIVANDNADLAEVKKGVEQTLKEYFHPLKGGEDGHGWPFGGTIYYSRVSHRVFTVPGVQSITTLTIFLDGNEQPFCKDVDINEAGLLCSSDPQIEVGYSF
jgi:predicted phage baseplate assembly protein